MVYLKTENITTQVKEGRLDVCISLELTINVNSNGNVQVTATPKSVVETKKIEESDLWMIPDFSGNPQINFGKKE